MTAIQQPQSITASQRGGNARRSSANRAVAAVQESFPVALSPSPLIRIGVSPVPKPKPVTRYLNEAALLATRKPDPLASEREHLSDYYTIVKGRVTLLKLPDAVLRHVFEYVGGNLKEWIALSRVCHRFYYLTFDLEAKVTLIPTLVTTEQLSKPGSMVSLARHLNKRTRGAHITNFSVISSKAVSELPRHVTGPLISKLGLQMVISNLSSLVKLDVRGVLLRDFSPANDHFLSDLPALVPKLVQLRIGVQFARNWDAQWWTKMPHLNEFVVGSRREDVDWHDPSPLRLHEDVFAMLRSPQHSWHAVKFWCLLDHASFHQLVVPGHPFPELKHLAVNCFGNTSIKPLEEIPLSGDGGSPVGGAGDKKKADAKAGGGKGGKGADEVASPKYVFPTLESLTVADCQDRLEFASEMAAKLIGVAPMFQYFNVTNTHRNGPTKVVASASPSKGKKAAAAA